MVHLQADLGRNQPALPAYARAAGAEHACAIQRLPDHHLVAHDGKRELSRMRWGLVPSWWSKPFKELRLATFNARAETVAEKPFYRSASAPVALFRCRAITNGKTRPVASSGTPHSTRQLSGIDDRRLMGRLAGQGER